MKSFFYQRLALTNIKNNGKTYIPFMLTCIGTILMFYNMSSIMYHDSTGDGALGSMMFLGTLVTGIFSAIFLFYTNSFLIKRRKKEFGLFNILGMEKRHVSKIIFWENIIISVTCIVTGILSGVLFNKLITLALYKILHFNPNFEFYFSTKAFILTVALFVFIFTLTMLSSLWQVHKSKPIELLHSKSMGEREPRSNFLLALIGVLTLGAGYYFALTVDDPFAIIGMFFTAVILVVIGTYCLFTAGSIVLLKALKRNDKFYYKTKHFISLSGMIFRMKKNAVGLANICAMSTAVLVMISTTISMYVGMDDLMLYRYPSDCMIDIAFAPEMRPYTANIPENIKQTLESDSMKYKDFKHYEYFNFTASRNLDTFTADVESDTVDQSYSNVVIMDAQSYTNLTGKDALLKSNEVLVYSDRLMGSLNVLGQSFNVKSCITNEKLPVGEFRAWVVDHVFIIVDSPEMLEKMFKLQYEKLQEKTETITKEIAFDFDESDEAIVEYCNSSFFSKLDAIRADNLSVKSIAVKQLKVDSFYELYGGLFFLGIFLGTLFLLATVLIIYYKQTIEGFEDKERFKIMQNVGLSKAEVKKTIGSQILTVFALPLLAAVVHVFMAFPILSKLLSLLNLVNTALFIWCTIATIIVFAVIYSLVYFLTSKSYYRIVNS